MSDDVKVGDVINNVKIKKIIKEGGLGKVFEGKDQINKARFAIKVIKIGRENRAVVDREISVGVKVSKNCPFLVDTKMVCWKDNGECCIGMEYCDGGDLRDDLKKRIANRKPFTRQELLRFAFQSCTAIKTLHHMKVIHRDIKPENFFLCGEICKLGDYGMAKAIETNQADQMTTMMGTREYSSLEILDGSRAYNEKADVFSLGIVILELFDLKHPFSNENGTFNMVRYINGSVNTITSNACPELLAVAKKMIAGDPSRRPSIDEVLHLSCLHDAVFSLYEETFLTQQASNAALQKASNDAEVLRDTVRAKEREIVTLRRKVDEIQAAVDEKDREVQSKEHTIQQLRSSSRNDYDTINSLREKIRERESTIDRMWPSFHEKHPGTTLSDHTVVGFCVIQ